MSRQETRDQERSSTWLRNQGVEAEMLRLVRSKGAPVRRIFRQLAELGVPGSMTEELTGCKLVDWHTATEQHEAKLQSLWQLAEAYTDVANRSPGALEGLDAIVYEALARGVYYDPPACAAALVEKRAMKSRPRFVEEETSIARPGRSSTQAQMMELVKRAMCIEVEQLTQEQRDIARFRAEGMSGLEIAERLRVPETRVNKLMKLPEVQTEIASIRPLTEVDKLVRQRANAKRIASSRAAIAAGKVPRKPGPKSTSGAGPGRPRVFEATDEWLLARRAEGWSLARMAEVSGTTKQGIAYRVRQALGARLAQTPTPLK